MNMTEEQIVRFLNQRVEMWSFSRLLHENYSGKIPLQMLLSEKLTEYKGMRGEDTKGTARKIRNWLNDVNRPVNRETLFQICFAMGLDEESADKVLCSTAESGIHYRNPREMIYAFCLRKSYDYPKAQELIRRLEERRDPRETQEQLSARNLPQEERYLTISVRDEFKSVQSEDELIRFLEKYRRSLGVRRNTAYAKFSLMMSQLIEGGSGNEEIGIVPGEKRYSLKQVTDQYLRMGIPYERKSRSYSRLQKEIKKHWPSAKTMEEMYSGKADVNRKTLLLLYFATEGMDPGIQEENYAGEHCRRINLMLSECGMALLDPHNPFDFLILQSLRIKNEDDSMSRRMERFLWQVFKGSMAYINPADETGKM